MDPLALTGAFATIVGLLSNFKAERSGAELSDFTSWLRERHRDEVANAIARNTVLSAELSAILATNHDELLCRLSKLNDQISVVASRVDGFAGLAYALGATSGLSEQAKSVLKQLVDSGAKMFMEHRLSTGRPAEYIFIDGAVGQVRYAQPQFMNEDLDALVDFGLLRVEFAAKGARKFIATRAGVEYASGVDG